MRQGIAALAEAVGLEARWTDAAGKPQIVSEEVMRRVLSAMGFPCETPRQLAESRQAVEAQRREGRSSFVTATLGESVVLPETAVGAGMLRLELETGEARDVRARKGGGQAVLPPIDRPGYHRLEDGGHAVTIAVAPRLAHTVADATPGRRPWGLAVQLYSLRGDRGEAFGDFGALAGFARSAADEGADAVAISPVHALFAADPSRYSPYAPSSRDFLNVLYAAPDIALGEAFVSAALANDDVPQDRRFGEGLIDWTEAGRAKLRQLARLHAAFQTGAPPAARAEFEAFRREGGDALLAHARFEALHGHFRRAGVTGDWQSWPVEFRKPGGKAVVEFAAAHADEVEFHLFLQFLAERGLAAAQAEARGAGMAIGLISDLAIGLHGGGSHAWSRPDELLAGLSVGAPPDPLNIRGQSWGLTAISPQALAATGFAPFLATLRAALRHAGGIRIDHVLGFHRLWLVPEGALPTDGAYLRYPLRDLLRLLALESQRHKAIVIGEDLGTVPEGYTERLGSHGIMGMSVLWFERTEDGGFTPPESWQAGRTALTTTHDLPTVAGWWRGRDIDWAERCHILHGAEEAEIARETRAADREKLWDACVTAGTAGGAMPAPDEPAAAVDAAIGFVAATPADLVLVPMEDTLGLEEQPNLPGTIDEHPNWRRGLPLGGTSLLSRPDVAARLDMLRKSRATP